MLFTSFQEIKKRGFYENIEWERTVETAEAYEKHKQKIKKLGLTPSKYILSQWGTFENYFFTTNKFGYNLPKDCEHYVLWLKKDINIVEAKKLLSKLIKNDFIFWSNPPHKKSVADLAHYQVIIHSPLT